MLERWVNLREKRDGVAFMHCIFKYCILNPSLYPMDKHMEYLVVLKLLSGQHSKLVACRSAGM